MTSFTASRIRSAFFFLFFLLPATQAAFADNYQSEVRVQVLKKTTTTSNGQRIRYPSTDSAEVTAVTVELAPGAETGWHRHPVPVCAYVLSGSIRIELEDGKRLLFKAGDAIIEVVDTLHNGRNTGMEPVRLAVFYLGSVGKPNVIRR